MFSDIAAPSPRQPVSGSAPLYTQIRDRMRVNIESGVWKPGAFIPTETELAKLFGVSSGTIKQAVLALVREGLLSRRSGKGTFVPPIDTNRSLARFFRFRKGPTGERLARKIRLLSAKVTAAPESIAQILGDDAGEGIIRLKRLIIENETPICLYDSYLNYRLVRGIEKEDLQAFGLYDVLHLKFGIDVVRADELLDATSANREQSKLLGIRIGSPVIRIQRTAFTFNDRVVECRLIVGGGDNFKYYSQIR